MTKQTVITIPFDGFYNTLLSDQIDFYEDYLRHCADHEIEGPVTATKAYASLCNYVTEAGGYAAMRIAISEHYVRWLNGYLKELTGWDFCLEFHRLHSPKEYNFANDEIDCLASWSDLEAMADEVDVAKLWNAAKEMFTDRPGFAGFHSPDIDGWHSSVLRWNPSQLLCLLNALLATHGVSEEDLREAYASVDGFCELVGEFYDTHAWYEAIGAEIQAMKCGACR
ncbi:hypothetical protein LJC19_04925 [Oxalobacter sp. OttesenSCG-928-P03]|nr:hypothetical protein [Oxalobacter sp. OttesenSCG-928-P03]